MTQGRVTGVVAILACIACTTTATTSRSIDATDLRMTWVPDGRVGRLARVIDSIRAGLASGALGDSAAIEMADEITDLEEVGAMRDAVLALFHTFPDRGLRRLAEELALRAGDPLARLLDGEAVDQADALRRATAAIAAGRPLRAFSLLAGVNVRAASSVGDAAYLGVDLRRLRLLALADPVAARRGAFATWQQAIRSGALRHAADAGLLAEVTQRQTTSSAPESARRAEGRYLEAGSRSGAYAARSRVAASSSSGGWYTPLACSTLRRGHPALGLDCLVTAMREMWVRGTRVTALALARQLRETPAFRQNRILLRSYALAAAPILEAAGDVAAAENLLRQALLESPGDGHRTGLTVMLSGLLRRSGRVDEAARVVSPSVEPGASTWVELERALIQNQRGQVSEAASTLRQALPLAGDPVQRTAIALGLLEVTGTVADDGVMTAVVGNGSLLAAWQGYAARSRGDLETASAAFETAVRGARRDVAQLPEHGARLSMWRAWKPVIDTRVRTLLELGRPVDALAAMEMAGSGPETSQLAQHLLEHLRPGLGLLLLTEIESSIWAWVGSDQGWRAIALPRRSETLAAGAGMLVQAALASSPEVWKSASRRLTDALFRPLVNSGALDSMEGLIIIDWGSLQGVPLDALPWPGSDEPALERLAVVHVGSLVQLDALWHAPPRAGVALAVAPRVGPTAAREIRAVLAGTQGAILRGQAATEEAVRRQLGSARVLHFTAHSAPPDRDWHSGGLRLRSSRTFDGWLTYNEIEALPVRGAHVVLLGCETAATRRVESRRIEPGSSLADAFMVAGARSVLSWLWPISDVEASEFAELYYANGGPGRGVDALVAAKQRLRARYPDQPRRWAGAVWHGLPDGLSP